MTYPWEEVKRAVERVEDARVERVLAGPSTRDARPGLVKRLHRVLEVGGAIMLGLHVAVATLAFNYLVFVWLFHVSFDF